MCVRERDVGGEVCVRVRECVCVCEREREREMGEGNEDVYMCISGGVEIC